MKIEPFFIKNKINGSNKARYDRALLLNERKPYGL